MSIARHHAEWLSLVPVSGPFLSLPVLMKAFNTGLEPHDPEQSRLLRQEYGVWQDSFEKRKSDPAPHQHWIKTVLTRTLELDERILAEGQAISQTLQVEVPEHHELLRPSIVLNDPNTQKPRLLVQTYPRSQDLTSYVPNSHWKASPDTRMTELLHGTGVRLGLVTNGEHWMLVDAPKGETTGYSSWYSALWLEEPITLRAFRSLLSAHRFFGVADAETLDLKDGLLDQSASNQQEVTEQLGYQVRRAVEVLIHSLDRADQDFGRELFAGVPETALYESALTVMMRLVFLFCAEERELIPSKPFPVYEQNYSVSTISKQLRELADQHGEELLERRYDAWPRLLSAFRAVYGGLQHNDVHIPAYGGNLFNPDRFPFLEGRLAGTTWRNTEASPLPVNNRTVLHLLEALQLLQIKLPGGGAAEARRLSFRALDIEQIGHVYEGLLDHTAKRAAEPFLGLEGTRAKEPEIALAVLEEKLAKGEAGFIKFLKEETGKSENALKKSLKVEIDSLDAARFRTMCQADDALWKRVQPFAGLVRVDNFGYPVVIPKGSVFVTSGTDRRSSGTHYTPRSLTEPIVQYTLEPLVYVGPAEGKPKSEWKLKSAKELLDLKICDMACGSGAFLVQAARYMSERVLEAWDEHQSKAQSGKQGDLFTKSGPTVQNVVRITPYGHLSQGGLFEQVVPLDPAERSTYAMRIIVQRCLYGVDINPLATEMAKLSLWLLTLAKDKPFEFLDHSIRCGDSLVGLHDLDQLRNFSLKANFPNAMKFGGPLDEEVDTAISLRLKLEDMPANTVEDVERQEKLLREANDKIVRLRCAADLLVAAEFWGENTKDKVERVRHAAVVSGHYIEQEPTEEFEMKAEKERLGLKMFHWPLEFPEVIVKRGGFDAFLGNPPFMGGQKITGSFGVPYREHIVCNLADSAKGSADLCTFFVLRAASLANTGGCSGILATKTISEGDTRSVGLDRMLSQGIAVYRTHPSIIWPGSASVLVAAIWFTEKEWHGPCWIGDSCVNSIDSTLAETVAADINVLTLYDNANKCFIGSYLQGTGFYISPEIAHKLTLEHKYKDVIRPLIRGEDVNRLPTTEPNLFAINFAERTLDECRAYPKALEIVEKHVYPERNAGKDVKLRKFWWKYKRTTTELYRLAEQSSEVLVQSFTSKYVAFRYVPSGSIFAAPIVVVVSDQRNLFAVLSSGFHELWVVFHGSSMGTTLRYTPSDCFETFPFPKMDKSGGTSKALVESLCIIGKSFDVQRNDYMKSHSIGLTALYNRIHNKRETSGEIFTLREAQMKMNHAVASAYGWTDLDLDHDFHETKQGVRFTINEAVRREVLQRLLKLNHERYAEEVKQGLHGKKGAAKKVAPKKKATSKPAKDESTLFDMDDDE